MSTLTLALAIMVAILLVFLVFTVALMRTQREDALFEHNVDIARIEQITAKYNELRHFEAAQLINVRTMSARLEEIDDVYQSAVDATSAALRAENLRLAGEIATLREQQELRSF